MASLKQQFITTLSDLKNCVAKINQWFTADSNTDITFAGMTIPSRAKWLSTVSKGDKGDTGPAGENSVVPGPKGDLAPDAINYAKKDLSNVADADFKAKYDSTGAAALPTKLFTMKSGKFFVRKVDGGLPLGILSSKVCSLANWTSGFNVIASGKTHIEVPAGLVNFKVAGAGGQAGGGDHGGGNIGRGAHGGQTNLGATIALGGDGGHSVHAAAGNSTLNHAGNGKGGKGGIGVWHSNYRGQTGANGEEKNVTLTLVAGQVISFNIGAGGNTSNGGRFARGGAGANGYIEVEYM